MEPFWSIIWTISSLFCLMFWMCKGEYKTPVLSPFSARLSLLFLYYTLYLFVIAEFIFGKTSILLCIVVTVFCCDEGKLPQRNLQYSACYDCITRFFQQVEYCLFMSGMTIFRFSCLQCGFRRYSCAFGRKMGKIIFRDNSWGPDTPLLKLIYSWSERWVLDASVHLPGWEDLW